MLTNCEGITIYREETNDFTPTWKRHIIKNVYWEDTQGAAESGKGMQRNNDVFISIPAASISDYIPHAGDAIVKGIADIDYRDVPAEKRYTINSVSDFRYGSPAVQHIEVTAK